MRARARGCVVSVRRAMPPQACPGPGRQPCARKHARTHALAGPRLSYDAPHQRPRAAPTPTHNTPHTHHEREVTLEEGLLLRAREVVRGGLVDAGVVQRDLALGLAAVHDGHNLHALGRVDGRVVAQKLCGARGVAWRDVCVRVCAAVGVCAWKGQTRPCHARHAHARTRARNCTTHARRRHTLPNPPPHRWCRRRG
jgi:hypothetical protein